MEDNPALAVLAAALAGGDEDIAEYLLGALLVGGDSMDPDEVRELLDPFVEEHDDPAAAAGLCDQIVALAVAPTVAAAGTASPVAAQLLPPEPEPEDGRLAVAVRIGSATTGVGAGSAVAVAALFWTAPPLRLLTP